MSSIIDEGFRRALKTNFENVVFGVDTEVGNFMGVNSDIIYNIYVLKSPHFDDGEISTLGTDLVNFSSRSEEINRFVAQLDRVIKASGHWWGYRSKKTGRITQEAFHFEVHVGKGANLSRKNSKDRPHKKTVASKAERKSKY